MIATTVVEDGLFLNFGVNDVCQMVVLFDGGIVSKKVASMQLEIVEY